MIAAIRKYLKRVLLNSQSVLMNENFTYKKYEIGEGCFGYPQIVEGRIPGTVKIGKYCSFGSNTKILLVADHRLDWVTTYPFSIFNKKAKNISGFPKFRGDIIIENDVLISRDSSILSGVTVGNGAVIGAGAYVIKNVPPYAIVGGNPAKIIRYRFSPEQIARLLEIKWWDWPKNKIEDALPYLLSDDIDNFIKY